MEVIGAIKDSIWGKKGASSLVAQLGALNSSDFQIDPNKTYAEMWMGTHKLGAVRLKATGEPLPQKLPYMFKLVSVGLSGAIQVHPDKEDAVRLHRQRPHAYPDSNHRPKLSIALVPMVVLCGFRPYSEIYRFFVEIPPLRQLLVKSEESIELMESGDEQGVRDCYERIFTMEKEDIAQCVDSISENHWKDLCKYGLLEVFNELKSHFPYDVGLISLFFLNMLKLDAGEAVFMKPREVHCHVSGDFVACMIASDNVIRGGLTREFKDYGTLIACADFEGQPKETKYFRPQSINDHVRIFAPVEDFTVIEVRLPHLADDFTLQLPPNQFGAILLTLSGERTMRLPGFDDILLKRGSIIYLPPEASAEVLLAKLAVDHKPEDDDTDDDESSSEYEDFLAYTAMGCESPMNEFRESRKSSIIE